MCGLSCLRACFFRLYQRLLQAIFNSLNQWDALAKNVSENCYVVYGGELVQERSMGNLLGREAAGSLEEEMRKRAQPVKKKTAK